MTIRPFRDADAPCLPDLYRRAVLGVGALHYSPEQAAVWADLAPAPEVFRTLAADGRLMLVATDADDQPLAFGDLEQDGHIEFLYCAPQAAGSGLVLALYEALAAAAVRHGILRLFTEASEPARRFFEKRGFTVTARRDFSVAGVPIHNYAMEKHLSGGAPGLDPGRAL